MADTAHIKRKMFDLPYAHLSPAQALDVYWPPQGNGPFPVILSIHGGAFMGGDKRDVQVAPMLAGLDRGYAVVSINYRMSGEALFPALVHDVKAAIRWMRAKAAAFLFDPDRLAVWGGSAGGYLALMAGVTAGVPVLEDPALGNADQPCHVQAVGPRPGPPAIKALGGELRGVEEVGGQQVAVADSPTLDVGGSARVGIGAAGLADQDHSPRLSGRGSRPASNSACSVSRN